MTIDTLRADHLGCYGYPRGTSPFLDGLARRGVLFERAYSSCSHTGPAHASLFTGLHPSQHGVRRNGMGFPTGAAGSYRTLAELVAERGYDSAGFSAVAFLRSVSRGLRSFEGGGRDWQEYAQADVVVDRAIAWLRSRRPGDRFLLFVHLFDPHVPQRAPEELLAQFRPATRADAEALAREAHERRGVAPGFYKDALELAREHGAYDAEIRLADRAVGRLFDAAHGAGLLAEGLFLVTADHGEGLGSHSYGGHGARLYEEQLRVPLIVYRAGLPPGRRVRGLARHVDIVPTLLDLVGAPFSQPGFDVPGRSLRPSLEPREGPLSAAEAFAQRRLGAERRGAGQGETYSLMDAEGWKFIENARGPDELYDLGSDPLERRNLLRRSPERAAALRQAALRVFERAREEGRRVSPTAPDDSIQDELRALGYVR
ncbi:MAG TPA: sulfatase [Vicinamibacteria bacterium]|nr:sulfatase [Vicinamibacteria bacterium]